MNLALSVENLSVSAGEKALLKGLTFGLSLGERIGLEGPSGCGKTTLLRTVCGLCDPTEGTILLHGKTAEETGWPSFRRKLVFVAQQPRLFPGTVRENLEKPFTYKHASSSMPMEFIEEMLHTFGLSAETLDADTAKLSQGEKQRIGLIRALSLEPDVLLLDEPTSALDPETVTEVEEVLRRKGEHSGLAALVVSHDPEQIRRLCNRRISLVNYATGRLADA